LTVFVGITPSAAFPNLFGALVLVVAAQTEAPDHLALAGGRAKESPAEGPILCAFSVSALRPGVIARLAAENLTQSTYNSSGKYPREKQNGTISFALVDSAV
jgi:hypothetical protein